MRQIFTRDNSEKQMRNSLGPLSNPSSAAISALKHRFPSFRFFPHRLHSPAAHRTASPTQRLHTPECNTHPPERGLLPSPLVHGLQSPGCNTTLFPRLWKSSLPLLSPESPLPAHLGAPGALQHLLGERDHVSTTGVHLLREKPLHRLTESRLRIRGPSRHHFNQ